MLNQASITELPNPRDTTKTPREHCCDMEEKFWDVFSALKVLQLLQDEGESGLQSVLHENGFPKGREALEASKSGEIIWAQKGALSALEELYKAWDEMHQSF